MAVGSNRWTRPAGDFHTGPRRRAHSSTSSLGAFGARADEVPRLRVLWLMAAAALLASAVWGRLAYWQVSQHARLSAAAEAQYSKYVVLPAQRGMIYDARGRPLAVDTTVYDVFVAPKQVADGKRDALATQLSS